MTRRYGKSPILVALNIVATTWFFDEYQRRAWGTAIYPDKGFDLNYPILKLNGESGEVAEKYAKILRDKDGIINDEDIEAIAFELGDVLWYISAIATTFGINLSEIAEMNLHKLQSRKGRDKIHGSGDDR